jgi:hypothetical protein
MDMGFPRRPRPVAIDLAVLLARTSALQAASPTAQAQSLFAQEANDHNDVDQRVALFEGATAGAPGVGAPASFASLDPAIFSLRQ